MERYHPNPFIQSIMTRAREERNAHLRAAFGALPREFGNLGRACLASARRWAERIAQPARSSSQAR